MWERVDLGILACITVDSAKTCQGVLAVDVHGAGTANAFTARATESERGVNFVLDFDKGIQDLARREEESVNRVSLGGDNRKWKLSTQNCYPSRRRAGSR